MIKKKKRQISEILSTKNQSLDYEISKSHEDKTNFTVSKHGSVAFSQPSYWLAIIRFHVTVKILAFLRVPRTQQHFWSNIESV